MAYWIGKDYPEEDSLRGRYGYNERTPEDQRPPGGGGGGGGDEEGGDCITQYVACGNKCRELYPGSSPMEKSQFEACMGLCRGRRDRCLQLQKGCTSDADCAPGFVCKDGKCIEKTEDEDEDKDKDKDGGGGGDLGEFKWGKGISGLWDLLLGRAKEVMGMPYGLSEEAKRAMFGLDFEKVRAKETGTREGLYNVLSRAGKLGTGVETGKMAETGWQTEKDISDLMRQLLVYGEEKKKSDILEYTGLGQKIMESGINMQQIQEAINAARRGEGSQALALLLSLWNIFSKGGS